MQTTKLYEILSSYNRYWTTGNIDAGINRDLLPNCLGQLDSKEVVVLKGGASVRQVNRYGSGNPGAVCP